jgi:protein kinase C substrate 80K-H
MNLNSIRCSQQQKDEYENTEGLPTDGSESTEGLLREDLGRLVASRWTGEKTEHQVEEVEEFFLMYFKISYDFFTIL